MESLKSKEGLEDQDLSYMIVVFYRPTNYHRSQGLKLMFYYVNNRSKEIFKEN